VAGGFGAGGRPIAASERFDPATETLTPIQMAGMAARARHTATLLTDGRVLIAGGQTDTGLAGAAAEIWDVEAGTVANLSGGQARHGHTATLLADGRVLLSGGADAGGQPVSRADIFEPRTTRIAPITIPLADDGGIPAIAESRPVDGATNVPIDSRITLRLSHGIQPETATERTLVLSGPEGRASTHVVVAEEGRLVFLLPLDSLESDTRYRLTIEGVSDPVGVSLASAALAFTTASSKRTVDGSDSEAWLPDPNTHDWKTHRPRSSWQDLPALHAEPGATDLAGQVLTLDGRPLAGVTLKIDNDVAGTDRTGRFLL